MCENLDFCNGHGECLEAAAGFSHIIIVQDCLTVVRGSYLGLPMWHQAAWRSTKPKGFLTGRYKENGTLT